MTLALEAAVIAGGLFCGRLIARVVKQRRERRNPATVGDADSGSALDTEDGENPRSPSSPDNERDDDDGDDRRTAVAASLAGFVCKPGDVVVRRLEGDEAWLAGALIFAEERPVAALFVAPDTGAGHAVLVPGPSQTTLTWLAPVSAEDLTLLGLAARSGEPPQALEHAGVHFERTRRLPVRVERWGAGAPRVGATAILGEYGAPGLERLVVVMGAAAAFAWSGVSLSEAEYEVLPAGERIP